MKRILSFALAVVMIFTACLTLSSCSENDGAPSGMKLARGGDNLGYYFYVPEAWSVSNQGDIAVAFASKVARTSVTLVKTELPEGELGEAMTAKLFKSPEAGVIEDYFKSLSFPFEITVTETLKATEFGDADKAFSFCYEYKLDELTVKVLQYYIIGAGGTFLFTYTSNTAESYSGSTNYELYFAGAQEMISAFKTVKPAGDAETVPEYVKDADGYILVSDKVLSGFDLYVPSDYKVDYASGAVGVSKGTTSLTVTEISYNALTLEEYVMNRITDLGKLVGEVKSTRGAKIEKSEDIARESLSARGDVTIFTYEYTYSYRGVDYTVYQALISPDRSEFFAFTLTASNEDYATLEGELKAILDKLVF